MIRRHEEHKVQHLTMSIAAPTSLSSFTFLSSLMGGEATNPDDDDDPDDDSNDHSTGKDSDRDDASCPLHETSTDDHPSDEDSEDDNYE